MSTTLTANAATGKRFTAREAARAYLARGLLPIPVRDRSKRPIPPQWEQLRRTGYDLDRWFPIGEPLNVGVSLGEPSGGLIDVDLDCAEARRAAAILMPPTGMVWGRASATDSHRGYVVADTPGKASEKYDDPIRKGKGARLLELRSTGAQTLVPPSSMPGDDSGKLDEPCVWRSEGDPAPASLGALRTAMGQVASAALLGRYWREGTRHDCALALAGGLLRAGWSVGEAIEFLRAVCAAALDDEVRDREEAVRDTATALERGEGVTGWPALANHLGEVGEAVVKAVRGWLGIRGSPTSVVPLPVNGRSTQPAGGAITLQVTRAPGKPGRFLAVAAGDAGELHRDVIDLNSATARGRFVAAAMGAALPEPATEEALAALRKSLDAQLITFAQAPPADPAPPAPAEPVDQDPRIAELAKMPESTRRRAVEYLDDPDLLDRVSADLELMGVVGERRNRVLLYVVGTSTQLPRPLAAITRGGSSSGKSFMCEQVSRLFPPEVVLRATNLTTNALYYFPAGFLRHRLVVAGERSRRTDDDAAEATRALREMIESGRLSKATPVKEGDRYATKVIEQDGPIAYIETTTQVDIFAEDANRCLLLNTDETEGQTRRIMLATAAAAAGTTTSEVEEIRAVHHAIQRMVPRVDVVVPFASAIAGLYPARRLEGRRDFRHLLQLVKAVALLHFRQRERTTSGAVVATLDDYDVGEQLARGPLGSAASGVSQGAREFLEQLRGRFDILEFSTTEAKQIGGASPRTLEGRLHELTTAGAVEQQTPPKGRVPARWKLTSLELASGAGVLPSRDEVRAAMAGCERANNAQMPAE